MRGTQLPVECPLVLTALVVEVTGEPVDVLFAAAVPRRTTDGFHQTFRLIERIHLAVSESGENLGHGHGDLGLTKEQTRFDEGPLSMLIPLLLAATVVLVVGI